MCLFSKTVATFVKNATKSTESATISTLKRDVLKLRQTQEISGMMLDKEASGKID